MWPFKKKRELQWEEIKIDNSIYRICRETGDVETGCGRLDAVQRQAILNRLSEAEKLPWLGCRGTWWEYSAKPYRAVRHIRAVQRDRAAIVGGVFYDKGSWETDDNRIIPDADFKCHYELDKERLDEMNHTPPVSTAQTASQLRLQMEKQKEECDDLLAAAIQKATENSLKGETVQTIEVLQYVADLMEEEDVF